MLSFQTIPFGEIRKLLDHCGLKIPQDPSQIYEAAYDYLLAHPDSVIPSGLIADWVWFYHNNHQNFPRLTTSSILSGSGDDLINLFQSLGLNEVDRERIIRILGYLGCLDNDRSVFDLLPKEVLRIIGLYLDTRTLGSYGRISRRFYLLLVETGEHTEMMRCKLQKSLNLDLSHHTRIQLSLLCREGGKRTDISAGEFYSLLISQGQVWSWGENACGQLGVGCNTARIRPTPIEWLDNIIAVSAGRNHSLFLNANGQVYSCGSNHDGQLGIEITDIINQLHYPTLINEEEIGRVIAISAGRFYSLILNARGQVFSFGLGFRGNLGLGNNSSRLVPTLIKETGPETRIGEVVAISAGKTHSLILNSQGLVFGFGDNRHNQLGRPSDTQMIEFSSPILIQSSEMGEITAISAGREFSLFLNDQGQVFGLGANNCGQLGIGEFSGHFSVRLPTKLDESRMIGRIVAISAGDTHSLVLNSQGQVYSFGANKHHQLGFGDTVGLCHPTLVKSPEIGEIVSISAGSTNSLMINSQGQFLTCGYLEMSEAKWAKSPTVFFNQ